MIASLVTTYNRPQALARSLPQIAALGWPVLVVADGADSEQDADTVNWARPGPVERLLLPDNRGLAAALNIGLDYLLADPDVTWVSYFQDDVDLSPDCGAVLRAFAEAGFAKFPLITGHDAAEHPAIEEMQALGQLVKLKNNCRATHLFAHRDYWLSVMPIPTRQLHAPCRDPERPNERGVGSNVDWWIVRDAPNSIVKRGGHVLCIPGLVRTFAWTAAESTWGNGVAQPEPEFA